VLVFTRKLDDAIIIGEGIEIKILRIGHDSVRIGVTAPPTVPIHRREVYDQIRAANAGAAAAPAAVEGILKRLRKSATTPAPVETNDPPV
jgi:carbon storage regulator